MRRLYLEATSVSCMVYYYVHFIVIVLQCSLGQGVQVSGHQWVHGGFEREL